METGDALADPRGAELRFPRQTADTVGDVDVPL